jgi:hypothetical protein
MRGLEAGGLGGGGIDLASCPLSPNSLLQLVEIRLTLIGVRQSLSTWLVQSLII